MAYLLDKLGINHKKNNMKSDVEELNDKTKENTDYMTLENNEYTAKIVYIYDGDTMHVVFKEFGQYFRWNCAGGFG